MRLAREDRRAVARGRAFGGLGRGAFSILGAAALWWWGRAHGTGAGVVVLAASVIAGQIVTGVLLQAGAYDGLPPQRSLRALGRQLIADPDWPRKISEDREDELIRCLWDNVGCLRDSINQGLPIRCLKNPEVGFERKVKE